MKRGAALIALALVAFGAQAQVKETAAALSVNGKVVSNGELMDAEGESDILLTAKRWRELGVNVPAEHADDEKLSARAMGCGVVFDTSKQLFAITVPSRLLPMQDYAKGNFINTNVSPSPKGVMIGYDMVLLQNKEGLAASIAHDIRTNVAGGVLTSTGQLNPMSDTIYRRGLTTWTKDVYDRGLSIQVGDVFTTGHNNTLGGTVNLGGVKIGTDRALSDEKIYPVPLLGGIADTRSTAEILVDGQRRQSANLVAGPYQFASTFGSAGLTNTSLIVRDEFGREQVQERAYYAMPTMAGRGKTEWDMALGKVRDGSSDRYGVNAFTANVQHGVSDHWTVRGSVQTTGENTNVSVGSQVSLGRAGGLSVDLAKSDNGQAYSVAYERRTKRTSVQLSHTALSKDYWQLSSEQGSLFKPKSVTTASFAARGEKWRGDVSYTRTQMHGAEARQEIGGRFLYHQSGANDFSVAVRHDLTTKDTVAMLGWQHRFGTDRSGSITHQFGKDSRTLATLQGNDLIKNTRVQWSLVSDGKRHYAGADLDLKHATVSADISNESVRLSARGGLWVGEGGVIPTKRSYGAFVVAEVPNTEGAKVIGSGRSGLTNKKGYVVFPNSAAIREMNMRVDTNSLPTSTLLETPMVKAVAPRRGGAKVVFPVKSDTMRAYRLYRQNAPLDVVATLTTPSEETIVAAGGSFGLLTPTEGDTVTVTHKTFTCSFVLPKIEIDPLTIARVDCKEAE